MTDVLSRAAGRSALVAAIAGFLLPLVGVAIATVLGIILMSPGLLIPLSLAFTFLGIAAGAHIGVRAGASQGFDDAFRELVLPAGLAASVPTALTWIGTDVPAAALLVIMLTFVAAGIAIAFSTARREERKEL